MQDTTNFSVSQVRGDQLVALARHHQTSVPELLEAWIEQAFNDAGLRPNTPEPTREQIAAMLGDLEEGTAESSQRTDPPLPKAVLEVLDRIGSQYSKR